MKRAIVALICGLVFGAGLIVSQMSNPAKVIGFLDITGNWDPSLALVMGGAVAVFGVLYRLALRQGTPLLAARFTLPAKDSLDAPLMVGALIFGVVQMGIFYTGVNTDWFRVFLGVMLLIAVMFNNFIRRKMTGER